MLKLGEWVLSHNLSRHFRCFFSWERQVICFIRRRTRHSWFTRFLRRGADEIW